MIDLVVVGGGINGVGIARDAAGRGLSVVLAERADLASGTSSASSKLVHGGLRYLEQWQFRLVRESLAEREVLLAAAPHLVRPLQFVLPVNEGMRPVWMLRLGLFLYDHLGARERLPPSRLLRQGAPGLGGLQPRFVRGFEYADCWADDARLVVANAIDAQRRGAGIEVGWAVQRAQRRKGGWQVELVADDGARRALQARAVVNTAGPWVEQVLQDALGTRREALRLVKGSHIVTRRLYAGEHAYTLQNDDKRVIFTIPYEEDYTLIGTTDVSFEGDPREVRADAAEVGYLCRAVSAYLERGIGPEDVVWSYAGVRPLYDDGQVSASTVTRDYVFDLDAPPGQAPMLNVFGGKLTTYRKLAEHALDELLPRLGSRAPAWTARAALPGGDMENADLPAFTRAQQHRYAFAPPALIARLCRAYGTRIEALLGSARSLAALGRHFGAGLYEAELDFMRSTEWTRSAESALWRRSKLGLRLTADEARAVAEWFAR